MKHSSLAFKCLVVNICTDPKLIKKNIYVLIIEPVNVLKPIKLRMGIAR